MWKVSERECVFFVFSLDVFVCVFSLVSEGLDVKSELEREIERP